MHQVLIYGIQLSSMKLILGNFLKNQGNYFKNQFMLPLSAFSDPQFCDDITNCIIIHAGGSQRSITFILLFILFRTNVILSKLIFDFLTK